MHCRACRALRGRPAVAARPHRNGGYLLLCESCAEDWDRQRQIELNLTRAERFLHQVIDNPRLLDQVEDGDTLVLGDTHDPSAE